ncbi:hypothetical protein A3860_39210 [Niastella vici]|uniref:Uncharacterized protein n=1 Tax=Niastella vici TaxID=1703345 RepID=A0A1V9FKI9_9BACT|nr:hypothetical protein A3860_39210 [Niastella vici]
MAHSCEKFLDYMIWFDEPREGRFEHELKRAKREYKKGLMPTAPATQALRSPLPHGRQMRRSKIGPTLYCKYRDWASLTLAFVEFLRFVWRDS